MKGNEKQTSPKRVLGIVAVSVFLMAFVLWLGRGKSSSEPEVFSESAKSDLANSKTDSANAKSPRSSLLFPNPSRPPLTPEQQERERDFQQWKMHALAPRGDHLTKLHYIIEMKEKHLRDHSRQPSVIERAARSGEPIPDWVRKMTPEEEEREKFRELAWARYQLEQFESKNPQEKAMMDLQEFVDKTRSTSLEREWRDLGTIHFDDGEESPRSFFEGDSKISSALSDIIDIGDGINNYILEGDRLENDWRLVGEYLKARRDHSRRVLDSGNPPDPHWHADHISWIEETAETIGIPLNDLQNENWIARQIERLRTENNLTKVQTREEKYKSELRFREEQIRNGMFFHFLQMDDLDEELLRMNAARLGFPPPPSPEEVLNDFITRYANPKP